MSWEKYEKFRKISWESNKKVMPKSKEVMANYKKNLQKNHEKFKRKSWASH